MDEKKYSVMLHLSQMIGLVIPMPLITLVAPLVLWLVKKEESSMINDHGREAVNFQLSLLIYGIAFMVFTIVTLGVGMVTGFILLPAYYIVTILFPILAAVKASEGKDYKYPLTIPLIPNRT
ncbi:DUF4870 domain-containing protein (plasmid) [Pontibacillus sp. ALD_SL1]|uniref:DUF4870 domain-containing protein n=1 Tax=Pontibacillus sp. ALD_SL1 TaxID=2777185 RepID=UPI001A975D34|nr:DUF4870 domain-containing protein [Pontibacillus sp. ALD_SL1]QST02858.1 DUF4870 domain-containing protein [Pontibacillus sp. ALD_SL1]